MAKDIWFDSCGQGKIHGCRWEPEGRPRGVVQIVHGIAEFAQRYEGFADFLTKQGFLVVAEDHMGHGRSINGGGIRGYFHGGWFAAVEDTHRLMTMTREEYPDIPYILFGHSMGSFMARTILCRYPDGELTAAILCGTGWQPTSAMPAVIALTKAVCKRAGQTSCSRRLDRLIFGSYNRKVEHPRTGYDWLTRDNAVVDAYVADPLCGFVATTGLLRDMMEGIYYIQKPENLAKMNKNLPVFFIAGGDDPVGNYGKGVVQAARAFRKAGMKDVDQKIYPLCRHEILNEINRREVYKDILGWIESRIPAAVNEV